MAREDFAGVDSHDGDLPLIHDGEDPAARMDHTDLEVIETPASSQGQGAFLVGDVVAKTEVCPA